MEFVESVLEYLKTLPAFGEWPDLQRVLGERISRPPKHWRLPVLACQAAGGEIQQALPAYLAVACLHTSLVIIDDLLDDDPRGEYRRSGAPNAANLACALQALGLQAVLQSRAEACVRLASAAVLNRMLTLVGLGQVWDSQNLANEDAYWRVVRGKSAAFFGATLQVGALLGGAVPTVARQVGQWGELYGEMIQIHDDLGDVLAVPANSDWIQVDLRRFSVFL